MFLPDALNARVMSRRASGAVRSLMNGAAALVQPVLLTPIPYQKIKQGAAPAYNFAQHFSGADIFALAPGSAALQSGLTISAAGMLGGTATTAAMNVYVTIRATNSTSGLYVDVQVRISVAQDPGTAPAPTLAQLDATTIRATRTAPPVNVPPIEVDILFGPTSPLSGSNGQIVYGALTGAVTYDMTGLSAGARRVAKQRWRVNWGDGTSFPASFAGAESNAVVLAGNSAPSELQAGSISPASGAVGTPFDLTAPVFDGNPTPTVTLVLKQAGVDVTASVSAGRFTSTAAGALVATWTATNGVGSAATSTASATISSAATKPAVAGAPTMTVISSSDIDVYMPADPADGGASISLRQLQFSLDGTVWATPIDSPPSPYRYTGLAASTYLYSRAVFTNSVGATIGASASAQTAAASTGSVTLTAYSRDLTNFDSGAAVQRDYAAIPFAGTGPAGQVIQARVYSADDNGATSSLWVDLATVDGAGNYTGAITAVRNESTYYREVRLKVGPGATVRSANRIRVGHVFAVWGQSEVHRANQPGFSNTAPEPLLTIKQQLARIQLAQVTGRNSTNPLKVAGVDALPAGASLAGRVITLSGTGTLRDWDIQDYKVTTADASTDWLLSQCLLREVQGSLIANYMIEVANGGRIRTRKCTVTGLPGSTTLSALIREAPGGNYGRSRHEFTRFENSPTDIGKVVAAKFYNCYFSITQNLKKKPTLWAAGTTYALDDYVYITSGGNQYAFASLQAGNVGNQPPTDGSSNTFWSRKAPHSDLVTLVEARETIIFDRCVLTFGNATITDGAVGLTNNIRIDANPGGSYFAGGVIVRDCILDRNPANNGIPVQIANSVQWNGPILFERCQIRSRTAGGLTIQAPSVGPTVTVASCEDLSTGGALATPANCVAATAAARTNDGLVEMVFHDRVNRGAAGLITKFPSNAQPYTSAFTAMINTFLAERPGEHVTILWHTLSGTGLTELFSDGATARYGVDDWAVHTYGTANGATVGLATSTWYAAPSGLASSYGEAFYQAATGLTTAGAALPLNGSNQRMVLNGTGQQMTCDRLWVDLYDYTKTKWLCWGPHRFEHDTTMRNAYLNTAGSAIPEAANLEGCRTSVRSMIGAAPGNAIFLPLPFDPMSYENGKSNGAGGWTDNGHPSDVSADGLLRWARLHAHAMMIATGLTRYRNPQFDQCYWDPAGAYVETWSSLGPITTTRKARGLANPTGQAHYGDVAGWELNGQPAVASIVAGRVRITPVSGPFTNLDRLDYGRGRGCGNIAFPDDLVNRWWMNMPLVDQGQFGVEGFSLSCLPPQSVLVSTVPGAPIFTSVAGQLTYLKGANAWPTGAAGQQITYRIKGRLIDTGGTQVLASIEGSPHMTLDVTSAGGLRLTVKDSTGAAILTTVSLGTISFGTVFDLSVTLDLATTNACWTTLNGVTTQRNFTGTANGLVGASRKFRFLASGATTPASFALGNWVELAVWNTVVTGGGLPPDDTNLRFRVTGPAANANAPTGAQKLGGDFT